MPWKIEFKKSERFIYEHSDNWLLKKFAIVKRLNELKNEELDESHKKYDEIVLGDDEFSPVALNLSILIHVGAIDEFKKQYQLLVLRHKEGYGYYSFYNCEDNFAKAPLKEQSQYTDLKSILFTEEGIFESLQASLIRVTESFVLVSFRLAYSETFIEEFQKILTTYKKQEFKIADFEIRKLFRRKSSAILGYDNLHLTRHGLSVLLEKSREAALKVIGVKITKLHLSSLESAFSIFVFSYKLESNETQRSSSIDRLGLNLKGNGLDMFSDSENEITILSKYGEFKALKPNSEMLFFNKCAFSDEEIIMHGGKFQYLVSGNLRLYIELTFTKYLSISAILLYYYEILAKYRYTNYKSYIHWAIRRYKNFLKETHFPHAFCDEISLDEKELKWAFTTYLDDFAERLEGQPSVPFCEVLFHQIEDKLKSIQVLDAQIVRIVNDQKDNTIVKNNIRLSWLVVFLSIASILSGLFPIEKIQVFRLWIFNLIG